MGEEARPAVRRGAFLVFLVYLVGRDWNSMGLRDAIPLRLYLRIGLSS
jgi:hypothetical protein